MEQAPSALRIKQMVVAVVFAVGAGVMGGLARHWFDPHVASSIVFMYGFIGGRACERLRRRDGLGVRPVGVHAGRLRGSEG